MRIGAVVTATIATYGIAALFTGQVGAHTEHRAAVDTGCDVQSLMRFNPCADLDASTVDDRRDELPVEIDASDVANLLLG